MNQDGSIRTPRPKFTRPITATKEKGPYFLSTQRSVFEVYSPRMLRWKKYDFDAGFIGGSHYILSTDEKESRPIHRSIAPVDSFSVFMSVNILPYYACFNQDQFKSEIRFLQAAYRVLSPKSRSYRMYRVSDDWFCDDMGRLYEKSFGKYIWRPYKLSGDLRNDITLTNRDGTTLRRPCYFFSGIAGYYPLVQTNFAFSLRYEFHHVGENRLDLRPTSIFPLESHIHKFVHSRDLSDARAQFFHYH